MQVKPIDVNEDVRSLSEFKRNTPELLAHLERSGRPLILTVNGRGRVVVQDTASYQCLLERLREYELRFGPDPERVPARHAPGSADDSYEQ